MDFGKRSGSAHDRRRSVDEQLRGVAHQPANVTKYSPDLLPSSALSPSRGLSLRRHGPRQLQDVRTQAPVTEGQGVLQDTLQQGSPSDPGQPQEPSRLYLGLQAIERRQCEQQAELLGHLELLQVRQEQQHLELMRSGLLERNQGHVKEPQGELKALQQKLAQMQDTQNRWQQQVTQICQDRGAGSNVPESRDANQMMREAQPSGWSFPSMEDYVGQVLARQRDMQSVQVEGLETRLTDCLRNIFEQYMGTRYDQYETGNLVASAVPSSQSAESPGPVEPPGRDDEAPQTPVPVQLISQISEDTATTFTVGRVKTTLRSIMRSRRTPRSTIPSVVRNIADRLGIEEETGQEGGSSLANRTLLTCSMGVVLLNAIFLAYWLNLRMDAVRMQTEPPIWPYYVNAMFSCIFTMEMIARLLLDQCSFFRGRERYFNYLDLLLLVSSWCNVAFAEWQLDFNLLRVLRVVRLARGTSASKCRPVLRAVRLMVATLVHSLFLAMWAAALLFTVLFVFAAFFVQGVEERAKETGGLLDEGLDVHYGSVQQAMLCLFMAVSGGRGWALLAQPLRRASPWCFALFIVYQAFAVVFLLNSLTALFVVGAQQAANLDLELTHLSNEHLAQRLRTCFSHSAGDSTIISRKQVDDVLQQEHVLELLSTIGLDQVQVMALFELMELEDGGGAMKERFVDALIRLRCCANGVDVASLQFEHRRTNLQVLALMQYVEHEFDHLEDQLQRLLRGMPAGVVREKGQAEQTSIQVKEHLHRTLAEGKALTRLGSRIKRITAPVCFNHRQRSG